MRRAIQLRMTLTLAWEGGIEGGSRRQDDGKQVGHGVMVVPANDHQKVEQGMRRQKTGARNRRWPIARAPCPRPECEPGDNEGDPDVLHKMRVEWAGFSYPRNAFVPSGTGEEHDQPVGQGRYRKNCGYQSLHGNLLRPKDEPGGLPVTGRPNKVCGVSAPFLLEHCIL